MKVLHMNGIKEEATINLFKGLSQSFLKKKINNFNNEKIYL